jgi:MFS superfamily sulfate permease-like transporter/Ca2+-binding EF-hand superfamily protein/CRP-like cAMP-binding protein
MFLVPADSNSKEARLPLDWVMVDSPRLCPIVPVADNGMDNGKFPVFVPAVPGEVVEDPPLPGTAPETLGEEPCSPPEQQRHLENHTSCNSLVVLDSNTDCSSSGSRAGPPNSQNGNAGVSVSMSFTPSILNDDRFVANRGEDKQEKDKHHTDEHSIGDDDSHEGHAHAERPPSIVSATVSGLINYMLMFGLCSAYGMIMFYDDHLAKHRGLGVKMCLSTAFFTGTILATRSEIAVAIGGTDLNPVVFLGAMITVMAEAIQDDMGLVSPGRRLGSSDDGPVMCSGDDTVNSAADCELFHEKIRATAIFTVTISSLILSILFFGLGRFKATRYVTYVPTSIMEAFLSCVGYKVFKYALKFCNYDPTQFIPAALIGVMLYFLKAMHVGNPAVVIPLVILLPLCAWYFFIFVIKGEDLADARKEKLMFPEIHNVDFWTVWTDSLGKADKVDIKAWSKTLPDLAIMLIVVVLDCLLKISSTEGKLPVQVHKDYEIQLHGISSFFSVLTGSTVGYMQLKFNVINYGVMGNVRDRRGGLVYAALCGAGFFTTIEHFNFLPRFFLGMLLFFAGAGFVAENLWGSRKYLSFREWGQILVILIIFVVSKSLLIAVVAGGLLTGVDFILRYAKISCIAGVPLRGGEIPMNVRQPPLLQRNLAHLANNWLMVIRLKGYIFFASATSVVHYMKITFEEQSEVPEYRRLRFIVFDCEQLDGMDASASKDMKKLVSEAEKFGIRVLWSHVSDEIKEALVTRTIVQDERDLYDDQQQAVDYVHKLAFDYRIEIHRRFMSLNKVFGLYRGLLRNWAAFEPFYQGVFGLDIQRFGCIWQYCTVVKIERRKTIVYRANERVLSLFLVHSGAVGVFDEDPFERMEKLQASKEACGAKPKELEAVWEQPGPHAIYNQGWFLNREMLSGGLTRHHAVAVEDGEIIIFSERNWIQMARERPYMARAISKMVIKQQLRDEELKNMQLSSNMITPEDDHIDLLEEDASTLRRRSVGRASNIMGSHGSHGGHHGSHGGRDHGSGASHGRFRSSMGSHSSHHSPSAQATINHMQRRSSQTNKGSDHGSHDSHGSHGSHKSSNHSGNHHGDPDQRSSHDAPPVPTELPQEEDGMESLQQPHLRVTKVLEQSRTFGLWRQSSPSKEKNSLLLNLPDEMVQKLVGIQTAQVLDGFELYNSTKEGDEDIIMPPMPKGFKQNLEIAFDTYARKEEKTIAWSKCSEALMYAGIFNSLLDKSLPPRRHLTKEEFLAVGHRACMAPLSAAQVEKVKNIFERWDTNNNGRLDREQLISVFREVFSPEFSIEEVEGVSGAWGVGALERMEFLDFLCVFSRFLRVHEQDWSLLQGFQALTGKSQVDESTIIKAKAMSDATGGVLTEAHAEEMLWAVDWRRNGQDGGKKLPFIDFAAAILMNVDLNPGKLPPPPNLGEYVDPEVMGFSHMEVLSAPCSTPKFVLVRPAEGSKSRSISALVPEMEFEENETLVSVEGMVNDLRDSKGFAGSRKSHLVTDMQPLEETGSILAVLMARRHDDTHPDVVGMSSMVMTEMETKLELEKTQVPLEGCRAKAYALCEMPGYSAAANYLSVSMGFMIILSVLSLFAEPLITPPTSTPSQFETDFWLGMETFFTIIFTLEYIIRLFVCDALGTQTIADFIKTPSNVCDLVALIPYYVERLLETSQDGLRLLRTARLMKLIRLLRVSRVMRLRKLDRHGSGFAKLAGPVAMVFTVIWGIYLMSLEDE